MATKITKDIGFTELLEKHPESVEVLMDSGMHCIGCPAAMFETLEQGAMGHGIDVDELVDKINEKLGGKKDISNFKQDRKAKSKARESSPITDTKSKSEEIKELSEDEINKKWEKMKSK